MGHDFPLVWLIAAFAAYTALLFLISYLTSRNAGKNSFFGGERKAPWPIVAYGMVGASISGVTFISVPGNVWVQNFFYMPLVFGFVVGYIVIAKVLLPLYYKMNLTSIYTYLGERFGAKSYKTGTTVFMVSRILGAAVRIFVVIIVLFSFLPKHIQASGVWTFALLALVFLVLLYLYTYRGGVKTIIWTDALQTTFMLLAVGLTIYYICKNMNWGAKEMVENVASSQYVSMFDWNWGHATNAIKQFVSGIFVTIAMTGLDQSMMQKNLACKDIKAAQKNMYTTSIIIVVVNFFFLLLGALLCVFASQHGGFDVMGITKTDELFPTIASRYFGVGLGIFFLIGLISASYPSAGAALTSLTTSFCVDFLHTRDERTRKRVHAAMAAVFFVILMVLFVLSNDAVVNLVYKLASYTYGPLLGMFFFGILTKRQIRDGASPYIAAASPLLCWLLNVLLKQAFGFDLGFSLLIVNGLLTFALLWAVSKKGRMILIADSGSTKVDWAYLTSDGSVERFKTTGINPAHLGGERITEILSGEVLPMAPKVDDIYFFGAGIVGEEMKLLLQRCFSAVWPEAKAELYSDVMASGLSLFGKGRGIACIMGTGSNSCLYDDGKILAKVNAGGFILGDEGSGAWIGKHLLMDYVKGIMPADLLREFEAEYELSYPKVVSKVYKEERPAAYLASLNMFAASRMENPYIETLIKRGFNEFIDRNIVMYEGFTAEKVGFIGSVALHYEKWLRECCANRGIEVGTILKAPLDGLIEFYKK